MEYHKIYKYYTQRGIKNIIVTKVSSLLTIVILTGLASFLISNISYTILFTELDLGKALLPGLTSFNIVIIVFVSIYLLLQVLVFILVELKEALIIRNEYQTLGITVDNSWPEIVSYLNKSAYDIARTILVQENYLIAMHLLEVFNVHYYFRYTKMFEWCINYTLFNYLGNKNCDPEVLRRRFRLTGVITLICSPIIALFLVGYYIIRYTYEWRNNPGSIALKNWTRESDYTLRDFNELQGIFEERKAFAYKKACQYEKSNPVIGVITSSIGLISGAILSILIIGSLINEKLLLEVNIVNGKSGIYFITLFGAIFGICKSFSSKEHPKDQGTLMAEIIKITGYNPPHKKYSDLHSEFKRVFNYKILNLFQEFIGVFAVPICMLKLDSEKIVSFINESTVYDQTIGKSITKYSLFDWKEPKLEAKLEQSSLNFSSYYRSQKITDSNYLINKPFRPTESTRLL